MDFKLFGKDSVTLLRLMALTIASLRSCLPWHCVKTHLNAPDQQTAKTSAFIEVITRFD